MTPIVLGILAGLAGAILPGKLSVTLAERAALGERGATIWRGTGGSLVHMMSCVAVGLATGPLLRSVASTREERVVLAAAYVAFGVALVGKQLFDRRRDDVLEARALGGLTLMTKWILVIGFSVWSGLVDFELASALAFAGGVWLGVLAWCAALLVVSRALGARHVAAGLRWMTMAGGTALIAIGAFAVRAS